MTQTSEILRLKERVYTLEANLKRKKEEVWRVKATMKKISELTCPIRQE